jgi:pyruvate formate-lyase activating enzyme-like uncharacterized protein
MVSHSLIGQRARGLCTCGHQYAAHQRGISNATCALCYCDQFKKDTNRIFKRDLSSVKGRRPLTEPPRRPLS